MAAEMQWQIDERTIRDCPGNRTEVEWREAVSRLEEELEKKHEHVCRTCKQPLSSSSAKYHVTETQEWLPGRSNLPRGRWARSARARTLSDARTLRAFMGPDATIWVRTRVEGGSTTYKQWRK